MRAVLCDLRGLQVGQDMCNWHSMRAGLDEYGALDARLGQNQMIACLAHDSEPIPLKDLNQLSIMNRRDLARSHGATQLTATNSAETGCRGIQF